MKIVVYAPAGGPWPDLSEDLRGMVCRAAGENTVVFPSSRDELVKEGADAEVFYGLLREEVFPFFPNLRWSGASIVSGFQEQ